MPPHPRPGRQPGRPAGRGPGRADPARRAACDVLLAVARRGAYANLLLPAVLRERGLTGRDAALATELCYGTLRGQGTYDAVLAVCSDRSLTRMDLPVLAVLRLGVHQLLATRVAAHAAVATSVDLARDVAGPRPAGFVNAVLRRVSIRDRGEWLEVIAPDRRADPAAYLALRYSYPRWVVEAFAAALGEVSDGAGGRAPGGDGEPLAETEAALAAGNAPPRVTLCALPGRCDPGQLAAECGGEPARWSPFGVCLAEGDPASVAAVRERRATVQDEASQLAALALARAELAGGDSRWLDLCAGPGGKAALLASLAAGRSARLLAADAREHRALLVRDALLASGLRGHGHAVVADGTVPAWRPAAFDRVLADVPCSGLGSLRRRPEARWRRSPAQVAELGGLQRALLGSALAAARPGGAVAYVTCSPHVSETRDVLTDVLAGRGDVEVLDAPGLLPEVAGLGCPAPFGRYAQFWPHRHGTDAIFLAVLRRGR